MTNENENKTTVEEQTQTPPATPEVDKFLEAAKKVREDSVSKEEFEKVKAERDKMLEFVLDGKEIQNENKEVSTPDIAELQRIRHDPDSTNLDIVKASLGIRDYYLEKKGVDLFVSEKDNQEAGERVAARLQEIVKQSDNDPKTFNFLFEQALAEDDSALKTALAKKRRA